MWVRTFRVFKEGGVIISDINDMSTMSQITLLMFWKIFYTLYLKKFCTLTWVCLGRKSAQLRHPWQMLRKDGNKYQFHRSAPATITCKSKETNTKVGIAFRGDIKQQEKTSEK